MKKLFLILVVGVLLTSCSTTKTHIWQGKKVTEKEYNRNLDELIHSYVKNSSEKDLKLLSELQVVYDTIPSKK